MEDKLNAIWYQMNMRQITSEQARLQVLDMLFSLDQKNQSSKLSSDLNVRNYALFGDTTPRS